MNMVLSGVAGSRPALEAVLPDGDGKRTVKGAERNFHAGSVS
jgi:hypothetical protein